MNMTQIKQQSPESKEPLHTHRAFTKSPQLINQDSLMHIDYINKMDQMKHFLNPINQQFNSRIQSSIKKDASYPTEPEGVQQEKM